MPKLLSSLLISATFITSYTLAEEFPRLDEALPSKVSIQGYEPLFDFDGDGCYPAAGISRNGQQNPGLKTSGAINGSCHDAGFLDISNTLHRYACIQSGANNFCAHIYDMYFEKDQAVHGSGLGGHRHDWETVAIWQKDGNITHASYSCHGDMYTRTFSDSPKEGNHVKFVYHKDGGSTHCFRFAKDNNEPAENHYGYWVTPAITSWYELKGDNVSNHDMRAKLNSFDYGSASIKVKDSSYLSFLNRWKPNGYPEYTQESIEASQP